MRQDVDQRGATSLVGLTVDLGHARVVLAGDGERVEHLRLVGFVARDHRQRFELRCAGDGRDAVADAQTEGADVATLDDLTVLGAGGPVAGAGARRAAAHQEGGRQQRRPGESHASTMAASRSSVASMLAGCFLG